MAAKTTPSQVESGASSRYSEARRWSPPDQPVAAYSVRGTYADPKKAVTTREKVMASTVSVDEYFDELINLVRKDQGTVL